MRIRVLAFLATLLLPLPMMAQATDYTYTGNDYQVATGVYTTSMSISGSITLDDPLGDGFGYREIFSSDIATFDFTDGVYTYTPSNSSIGDVYFQTNGSGDIDMWSLEIQNSNVSPSLTLFIPESQVLDSVAAGPDNYAYTFDLGAWSQKQSSPISVPEGSSFLLLLVSGACLCGVVFFRFRRRPVAGGRA